MTSSGGLNFAIVGAGSVGLALTQCLIKHKANVVLTGKDLRKVKRQAKVLDSEVDIQPMLNTVINADITLLTVPDDEIESLCKTLSINFKTGSVVAHCSGLLDSTILKSAKTKHGALICSLHPLNTFASVEESLEAFRFKFHRTFLYSEGDSEALKITNAAFRKVGFLPVEINREAKPLYHVACVFARDYLTVLMEATMASADAAQIDRAIFWKSIQTLIKATLLSIEKNGAEQALSGPIVRGDTKTIAKHLTVLEEVSPNLPATYADLGKHTLSLAVKRGELDRATILKIHKLLDKAIPSSKK